MVTKSEKDEVKTEEPAFEPQVFEVAEPDPVEETKPVKTAHGFWAVPSGLGQNAMGPYDSEKGAADAGAIWLASHPETSFEVVKRYTQVAE